MLKQGKEQIIKELAESLSRCTIAIATDYRGLSAKEMVQLRRRLTEQGMDYQVAKNTLTRFAADRAGKSRLTELLAGPLAIVFGYDDIVKPAQILGEHIRSAGSVLKVKGGILGDRLLTPQDVSALAILPPRDVLVSRMLSQLQAPLQGLHNVLSAPLRGLVNVLQARSRQMAGG